MSTPIDGLTGDRPDTSGPPRAGLLRGLGLDHVVAALHEGVAVVDASGTVLDRNEAFADLVGRQDPPRAVLDEHGDPLPTHLLPWSTALAAGPVENVVVGIDGPDAVRWLRVNAVAAEVAGQQVALVTAVDITTERRAADALDAAEDRFRLATQHADQALAHQASHDELTGVANRATLLQATTKALARAAVSGRPVALLFCDLDHFTLVNDSRGHETGDAVLVETADRMRAAIRDGDTVARLGGDEFVVLCESLPTRGHAEQVAQRLIDEITVPMRAAHHVSMTVSVGIALSEPGIGAADLLRNAGAALYRAKEDGRDRYALFSPELIERATRRLGLEHELREAMRAGSLFLDYQPVRRLHDGSVAAYEALVRWDHPVRGVLAPATFLPVAETSDLVLEIDRYVLMRACADAVGWGVDADAPNVSVNVSARHVGRGLLPGLVARALTHSGLEPGRLTLELTETALLGVTPTATAELDTLVNLGVRLAIDDFGTGYSSLTHLLDVPASYVKIDRSFVGRMASSHASSAVVEAVVSLCRALHIDVVAEGIEDEDQRARLSLLGCSYGQGFLLGRPGRIDLPPLERTGA